jgi:hypothetical protein
VASAGDPERRTRWVDLAVAAVGVIAVIVISDVLTTAWWVEAIASVIGGVVAMGALTYVRRRLR